MKKDNIHKFAENMNKDELMKELHIIEHIPLKDKNVGEYMRMEHRHSRLSKALNIILTKERVIKIKEIEGLRCYKCYKFFKGHDYEGWICPDCGGNMYGSYEEIKK